MQPNITNIMQKIQFFNLLILCFIMISCSKHITSENPAGTESSGIKKPGPHIIIYKTSGDYYSNVPVTLSADKKSIINYPGTKDVYYKGELAYPSRLNNGFLLDHRGISIHSAFTKFTYEEYSNLSKTPAPEELFQVIVDADPITEMYDCGNITLYNNPVEELNKLIEQDDFSSFKKIK